MTMAVDLGARDWELFNAYAQSKGMSFSDLVRTVLFEKMEDEKDLADYGDAMEEYHRNPVTFSLAEIKADLGMQ